jgi:hypothetical protein
MVANRSITTRVVARYGSVISAANDPGMRLSSRITLRSLSIAVVTALAVGVTAVGPAPTVDAAVLLVATPNPVPVPIGETSAVFTLQWDSGTGQDVELVFQRSGKPADPPVLQPSPGEMKNIPIAVGEIVTITMQEPGRGRVITRPITVTGVQAEQPSVPDCTKDLCAFETAEQVHGTWATITTYFAEIDEAYVEVNIKDDPQVDTFHYQLPQFAGPGVVVVNGALKAGTVYEYTVFVVDYFGNTTEETSGVFVTLERHVSVEFGKIEILDDSDNNSAGDFTFYFTLADDDWDVHFPSSGEVEWDTGTTTSFGVTLDATGVGTSIPLGFFVDDDDSDVSSGLCSHGLTVGSTGEDGCHSWITLTGNIDASITGPTEEFVTSGVWQGSNDDDLEVRVHWTAWVDYV